MSSSSPRRKTPGIFFPVLRRGDVLLLTHTSTVECFFNISNNDNGIVNSNLPCINIKNYSPFNKLIYLQKEIDTYSSVSINDEIIDENNISE